MREDPETAENEVATAGDAGNSDEEVHFCKIPMVLLREKKAI